MRMEKKKHKTDYFNVDDIHRIREENYKRVKDMSSEERIKYYNERGEHARLRLEALYKKNRVCEERMCT